MTTAWRVFQGTYQPPEDVACRSCGFIARLVPEGSYTFRCYPGTFAQCGGCGAILLYLGRVPDAPCIRPNGRIDGHGLYVRTHVNGKKLPKPVCDFCREPV